MIYSTSTKYAVMALTDLAARSENHPALTRDISTSTGIPLPFLAKLVQLLVKSGVDVHAQGFLPLRCSVYGGNLETVEFLLSAGAPAEGPRYKLHRIQEFHTGSTMPPIGTRRVRSGSEEQVCCRSP